MSSTNVRYPGSSFAAEYPYNQATITRSGHEIHINDTPGNESLRIAHRTGTFAEISNNGGLTVEVVGKSYYYLKDSLTETVDGHRDIKTSGSLNVNADNGIAIKTAGSFNEASTDRIIGATNYSLFAAFDSFESIGKDRTVKITGSDSESVGLAKVTSALKRTDIVGTVHTMSSEIGTEIMSGGTLRLAAANIILDADTITLMTKTGPITLDSASAVAITAVGAVAVQAASMAVTSPLGLLVTGGTNIDLNAVLVRANGRKILTA